MSPVSLRDARDERRHGGKAVSLGAALRAELPVPGGWALDVELVDAVAAGSPTATARCSAHLAAIAEHVVAVRSSAVGEDSTTASFAGQHLTRLGVRGAPAVLDAVRAVWASGRTASALGYRRRLGLDPTPRVAVVIQQLARSDCAGVLFTRDPVRGHDERVIEASWGLGEVVVAGLVTPDRVRMRRGGAVIEHVIGGKEVELVAGPDGTEERPVEAARAAITCLDPARLAALEALAARCERAFEGPSDLEFAFVGAQVFLLQRRAITR